MANKKLFDATTVTTPSGSKKVAIGDANTAAQNITLDNLRKWITGTTSPTTLLQKSFNIGTWSMPGTPGVDVTLTGIARDKIRGIEVIIRSNGNEYFPIWYPNDNRELSGAWKIYDTPTTNAKINISRRYNYWFDQSGFSGSGNRGYVLVTYVP